MIVEGSLKTNALIALVGPLVILAVPFLDTGFVVAKRIKYRRPVYRADSNHFHHRFHRMASRSAGPCSTSTRGRSTMAGLAVALRFVPYSDDNGHLNAGWAVVMGGLLLVGLAASVYLVYVLEILKLRRLRAWQLRRTTPTRASTRSTPGSSRTSRRASSPRCARREGGVNRTKARAVFGIVADRPDVRPPGGEQET